MDEARSRLDKWLWYARVVKTRALAQDLIAKGRVRVNRQRATRSSQPVGVGDVLTITLDRQVLVYEIAEIGERRGPFREASKLYVDRSPAPPARPLQTRVRDERGA